MREKGDRMAGAVDKFIANTEAGWLGSEGPAGDVIISSRIRLARNLSAYPFPHRLSEEGLKDLADKVQQAAERLNSTLSFSILDMGDVSALQRQTLVEKHLISPAMAMKGLGSALIISEDERVSIMVNEEDHLRIQCILAGLDLKEAYQLASRVDDVLEESLDYAYSHDKGYLTSCPTNTGTGLRASVMAHMPALAMKGKVGGLFSALSKIGVIVRGLYGEGTQSVGNAYQVSNQVSLGRSEEEIVGNLVAVAGEIRDQERAVREAMMDSERTLLEDTVYRAYGVLMGARVLTSEELMRLASEVKLGVDLGLLPQIRSEVFKQLTVISRPGYVQYLAGEDLSPLDRDIRRASMVRRHLTRKEKKGE